jgi:predicted transcriptional regulator
MVRRDRHDITMDILKRAASGIRKTELMSGARLSYSQTKQYLNMLLNNELLEVAEKHKLKTTKKGLEFLEKCDKCLLFSWEKQKGKVASKG